ncbi:hypothetical protein TPSea814_000073a [Treponema pallidum subsp. pallidum str. Sea 81-4]|uniref:Uncharacterized protein n=2 Tax=Treponema paraluiscuniculi TaxID=53435 RepID=F7XRR6_TREPU|nr:hypothetical protein TPChic_0073a [Treponema pallidum subsp. pallidum str. Chicago]AEH40028.1 hypothetical protein TPCCA_0073a [Treponema paraluiscuniculi Cuniculi A]AHN66777.1 hypothetical protein TPSea814_000073a [Treponema pallidum subsp. pallidum str. Sea 81-4]WKC71961.1 hypothetical protein TPLL2_0073a [Treponema paraluiscuniculi]
MYAFDNTREMHSFPCARMQTRVGAVYVFVDNGEKSVRESAPLG